MTTMRAVLLLALLTLGIVNTCPAAKLIGGLPPDEALRAGERMYREGILPSGEPMQALVQGDIPVDGSMFTCQNCHLRSGLGTTEGTIIALPTNGRKLFRPLHRGAEVETNPPRSQLAKPFQSHDIRPAYDEQSLAQAIWVGNTPTGRQLNPAMPRYLLDPPDMDILIYYLKQLSDDFSPGVSKTAISFATVISDEVSKEDQQSMLATLRAYLNDHNSQSRHNERRARQGPFYKQDSYTAYRRFELSVWRLHGPVSTWRQQLIEYAARKPVFALLGGISYRDWTPIEKFCNDYQLPNLFPVSRFPGQTPNNWYTLYFSRGLVGEAETAARYLSRQAAGTPTIIVSSDSHRGRTMTQAFRRQWEKLGQPQLSVHQLPDNPRDRRSFWARLLTRTPGASLILWLNRNEIRELLPLADRVGPPKTIVLSWKMLDKSTAGLPSTWRNGIRLTYPYRLPASLKGHNRIVKSWLRIKKLPVRNLEIQAQMYFLGWELTGITRAMGDDFYRDYFLDVADMMNDEVYAIATVPRASFGVGQRYAVKGCYIVGLDETDPAKLVPLTPWVVY